MKQILASVVFLTVLVILLAPSPAAAANVSWSVGSAFRIGGTSFHIAVRDGYYGGAPYYYRTRHSIRRPGYACGSACFRADGYYYHSPYCPLATAYFTGYGYTSYSLYTRFGPRTRFYINHAEPWGPPFVVPGPPIYPPYGYSNGPGYYVPYGYNLDRRDGRYERYDRHDRGHGRSHGHGHHD